MPVPYNIRPEHIHAAINRVNLEGVPNNRHARKYAVLFDGDEYPCKLLISWANEYANGIELFPREFTTDEAQHRLFHLGFRIIEL